MSSVATTLWVAQDKGFFAKNNIDVQTVFIPGSPTLVASLNSGDLEKIPLVGTSVVVKGDYLATHQAIARNTLRGLIEGHGFIMNPANKAAVTEIMTKKLAITDPVAANDGYDDYVRRTDRKAFVIVDGLKNIQRFMKLRNPKIGEMNLDRLVEESILNELEKSGFLDQTLSGKPASR